MTLFIRLLDASADDKPTWLRKVAQGERADTFSVKPHAFQQIPGSPFAYWITDNARLAFSRHEAFQRRYFSVRGAYTTDDFRFYRLAWEGDARRIANTRNDTLKEKPLVRLAKGGGYSPFYGDVYLAVRWHRDGAEAKAFLSAYRERKGWGTDWSACLNGYGEYFRGGVTWPLRTTSGLGMRAMPAGCIFGHKGPAAFVESDPPDGILALMSVVASAPFRYFVDLQMAAADAAARSYEVGVIQRTPVPRVTGGDEKALAGLARRAWSLKRSLDTRTEISHAFTLPALLQLPSTSFAERAVNWTRRCATDEAELATIRAEIDSRCFELYGIEETDRRIITEGLGSSGTSSTDASEADEEAEEAEEAVEADNGADTSTLTAELLSWAIGTAFGRFDIRLATGARPLPPEPEPFDPLPVCSPGMLTGDDGLPLSSPPPGYPLSFPADGLLADDPGHPRDLTTAARAVFDAVFAADAHDRWNEAAALLDPKGRDLRAWIARSFFELHLKRYSKSRRKAPILWQLATPSSRYAVWIYAHRATQDTFFQVENDLVTPKLRHEERKLNDLRQSGGPSPTAAQRKEIAEQEGVVEELGTMLEEVKRVAPLWRPDLDDGVILTMAPLHRLVPQHKAWQKELRAAWEALAAGKYDWAHLAMHLWPERVVPKCAEDRSLAIAHGLEEVFWVEGDDGKWKARAKPTTPVAELVAARSSPAVRDALRALSEAPTPAGPSGRPGRGKRK